jgi:hypothetical protein
VVERKSIKNHKRGGRTAEKHRETEETAKNKKTVPNLSLAPWEGEGKLKM